MPTRYPTAVQAFVRLDGESHELRLTIATNTGRVLEEQALYGATDLDADVLAQIERHLDRAGLRASRFEGSPRSGWRATVQSRSIDPDAATD